MIANTWLNIVPLVKEINAKPRSVVLPPKDAEAIPWDHPCIDLIGPYAITRKGQEDLVCECVTMIDPATGWFEMKQTTD